MLATSSLRRKQESGGGEDLPFFDEGRKRGQAAFARRPGALLEKSAPASLKAWRRSGRRRDCRPSLALSAALRYIDLHPLLPESFLLADR